MHTTEKVLTRLVEILREDLPGLRAEPGDARGQYFLLYYARLLELLEQHQVRFEWVKGHADNPYNNRCDQLAVAARPR